MLDLGAIGTWSDEHELVIPAARGRAYAAATNDPLVAHADGTLVPPLLTFPIIDAPLGQAIAPVAPDGIDAPGLHGQHDFRFHRPVRTDEPVRSRAAVIGVHSKGSGTTVVVHGETRDRDGELVVEQHVTIFYPGFVNPGSAGEQALSHSIPDELVATTPTVGLAQQVDEDQTWRFAGPSRDCNPIHLDDGAARAAGLPAIINHGMCTLAIVTHGLLGELADGDPGRLSRLAVRFSRPVTPGQAITTQAWPSTEDGAHHFVTTDSSGTVVMKDGLVVLRP